MSDSNDQQRWLAYELHDRLMPWIHGARMLISRLQVTAESAENLATANHCLKIAAEEGRSLIGFLESCDAENSFSLPAGLEQYLETTQPLATVGNQEIILGTSLAFPDNLSSPQSWSVLRILQQAMQNAIQHAGPCKITIGSQVQGEEWILNVTDNGIGFNPCDSREPNHFGLSSMQQRAEALGGTVEIHSELGKGTTVNLHLPVSQSRNDESM